MKKVLSMLLALAMVLTMAAFPAFAEEAQINVTTVTSAFTPGSGYSLAGVVDGIGVGDTGAANANYFRASVNITSSGTKGDAPNDANFHVVVDFSVPHNVTGLRANWGSKYATGIALWASNDKVTWTEIADLAPTTQTSENTVSHEGYYRYVKVEAYATQDNNPACGELTFYGTMSPDYAKVTGMTVSDVTLNSTSYDKNTLVDGDISNSTANSFIYGWSSTSKTFEVTLPETTTVSTLALYWGLTGGAVNGYNVRPAKTYDVFFAGEDGVYGEAAYSHDDTTLTGTPRGTNRNDVVTFDTPVEGVKKIKVVVSNYYASGNLAIREFEVFKYTKEVVKTPATYTVNYVDAEGTPVAAAKTVDGMFAGDKVTETAVAVEGYRPEVASQEVTLEAGENTITFIYVEIKDIVVDFGAVPEITPIESAFSTIGAAQKPEENIFDGNATTAYIAGWKTANSASPLTGCSITLPLDNYYDLSQINVLWGGSFGWWSEGTMTAGSIEVSTDGVEFVPVDTYTDLPAGESNGDNGFVREDALMFPAVAKNVKYVRINVTKMSASYLAVREITFNGVEHIDDVYQTETTYTVNYVDGEGNPVADADANVASYAGDIALANAKEIEGYRASADAAAYILGSDAAENVINFVYTKKVATSYTVNYVDEEGNPVADSKVVENAYAGDSYTEKPIKLIDKGYLYVSTEVDTSVVPVEDAASNVVTYTYKKIIPAVSATGKNNSTATGGGPGGDALYNGMIIGSQAQYIVDKAYDFSTPVVEYVLGYAQPYDFSKVYVYTNVSRASQVNFYVSNDGENWGEPVLSTSVADTMLTYTYANGASAPVYVGEYTLPEGSAGRYLKYEVVVATVSETQATWCHVYEIAAVGTKTDLTARPELAGVSEGAQIRLPAGTVTAGIRFGATIVKDVFGDALTTGDYSYSELAAKGIKVGMFILPQNLLGGHATLADYVIANGGAGQARDVAAQNIYAENDVEVTFTAVLTGIPDTEYNREIVAVPYVYIDGEYTFYAEMTRTYAAVAAEVAEAYEGGKITLTEDQITLIEAVIGRTLEAPEVAE